ncbi:MAG: patatin-like phospholipase family protein, partial [Bradymonadaceae bacterium]
MSDYDEHFAAIEELKGFERRLLKLVVDRPDALSRSREALFRYATNLAKTRTVPSPDGGDVLIAEEVDGLRRWMCDSLVPLIPEEGSPDLATLREFAPILALRLDRTRDELLDHHANAFGPRHLDDQMRRKRLVLVLGGGGGSGLFHLGTFSLFEELDVTPEFIVGSSMGSVMGVLRALDQSYDPFNTALALPRDLETGDLFRPFTGYSRYGFPGAFHLNLLRIGREIFTNLYETPDVRFSDLSMPLEIVTCGILRGYEIDTEEYEQAAAETEEATPLAMRDKLKLFFSALRQLSRNPRFLKEIVFGREPLTSDFPVIEALGFSCAVPGLLHFDIFHDDPATIEPLETLFESHDLLRLCDGGVVNNVPSNIAWESVQRGKIGSRNTFIASFDVFAPVARSRNVIWLPIQQMVRPTVVSNRPYSDFHKTFKSPPSPINVLVNSYSQIKSIVQAARAELEEDIPFLRRALEQLPP